MCIETVDVPRGEDMGPEATQNPNRKKYGLFSQFQQRESGPKYCHSKRIATFYPGKNFYSDSPHYDDYDYIPSV
jgi:hypothetical protein